MIRLFYILVIILIIAQVSCVPRGVHHVVQPGQTLYRISKTYRVPVEKLISSNRIKDASHIKVGQSLWIPGATRTRTVSVLPSTTVKKQAASTPNRQPINTATRPIKKTPSLSTAQQPHSSVIKKGQFVWPIKGSIVTNFDLKSGTPSKGIDISAMEGSGVGSAAAGKVIYSGNGITGYGHVVIIEHDRSLFTVYGYNKKNLVQSGTYVNSGQKIALVGIPPGRQHGRLHFEVWRNKKAVDPALYLP